METCRAQDNYNEIINRSYLLDFYCDSKIATFFPMIVRGFALIKYFVIPAADGSKMMVVFFFFFYKKVLERNKCLLSSPGCRRRSEFHR